MNNKNLVFMGTSEFSVPVLLALLEKSYKISMVYTRQDSQAGRGNKIVQPPVKMAALDNSLPVRQPSSLKGGEEVEYLKSLKPDVIIVSAYGLILPDEVLNLPPLGCINVHPSLLPKYRGPSPIPAAILAGEKETGVTIMLMDRGVDTGPIIRQKAVPISDEDNAETLTVSLARAGGDLLAQLLPDWLERKVKPQPQDDAMASYSRIIGKEDGEIDWSGGAEGIWRKVRAFYPWPGCYTRWEGKVLKIIKARPLDYREIPGKVVEKPPVGEPKGSMIGVGTGAGVLGLEIVQYEGGRPMPAIEFARGHRGFIGSFFPLS